MQSLRSSRTGRRIIASAASAMLLAGVAIGVSVSSTGEVAASPRKVSIQTALAAFIGNTDYYMKIAAIPGDSTVTAHANEIELQSLTWGVTNAIASGGSGTGKAVWSNLAVTKLIDPASPLLTKAVAAGTGYASILITADKNADNAVRYMTLTLTNARVTSVKETADKTNGIQESATFSYQKIRFRYTKQNDAGGAGTPYEACWDIVHNVAC